MNGILKNDTFLGTQFNYDDTTAWECSLISKLNYNDVSEKTLKNRIDKLINKGTIIKKPLYDDVFGYYLKANTKINNCYKADKGIGQELIFNIDNLVFDIEGAEIEAV